MQSEHELPLQNNTSVELNQLCKQLEGILHSEHHIRGVIFAVASAPEIPMPQQWFPWVFNQHGQLPNTEQADALADTLMDELKQRLSQFRNRIEKTDIEVEYSFPEQMKVLSPMSEWFTGLLFAHQQMQSIWKHAWHQMQNKVGEDVADEQKVLRHCLSMFSTFADMPLAIEQAKSKGNEALETQLPTIFLSLPAALGKYVDLSGKLVGYLPDQFEQFSQ